jgi:hypothetical protein
MSVENVKIQPMLLFIGDDTLQVQSITTVADVEGSLVGKYFLLHEPGGEGHAFWFGLTATVAPTIAGDWTLHKVVILEDDSSATIAAALNTAISALTGIFTSTVSGKVVTVSAVLPGYAQPARDSSVAPTGFAFRLVTLGFAEVSAGNLEGDIELSGFEVQKAEIKTHATGSTVQGEIITGYGKPVLKFNLYDSDLQSIKRALILGGGQTMIPEGAGAKELVGYGPTAVGGQSPTVPMRLHPVSLDDADRSQDWKFWKASFNLDSLKFSGENFSTIPMTVTIYPDTTKPKLGQFFVIGDTDAAGF